MYSALFLDNTQYRLLIILSLEYGQNDVVDRQLKMSNRTLLLFSCCSRTTLNVHRIFQNVLEKKKGYDYSAAHKYHG